MSYEVSHVAQRQYPYAIEGSKPMILNATPNTYGHDTVSDIAVGQRGVLATSSGVNALLNSCL